MQKAFMALAIAIILAGLWFFFLRGGNREQIADADANYAAGEKAKTIAEREKAFNRALAVYNDLEMKHHPDFGDGKLYFNLGNTYFQLSQYPMAVLNYYKALKLMPREEKIRENLSIAKRKLGIEDSKTPSVFEHVFFLHNTLSLPERLQLFFWISIIALISSSWYLWTKMKEAKTAIILSLIGCLIMLLSLGYSRYISPLEGVIIRSTDLHRDAGIQYAKVLDHPILGGTKVEVLEVAPNGKWLKVTTDEGQVGYAPQDSIRLI